MPVVDQQMLEALLPLAYEWARGLEEFALSHGHPLGTTHAYDAHLAGVKECDRVRVLVVDRIPLPEDPALAEAARRIRIITEDTRCMGFGHALLIRADAWNDRELIVHNLVHIAQCERAGGLENWVREYLGDRTSCADFTVGSLEEEARRVAHEICAPGAAA
ncbi:MAG: hypothetical protein DME57_05905 [Verrucomicrobia bacterium]|nr:MAG: hypothetical protein DME57_05905 [Verrucomicrobiota bacterium]